MPKINQHGLNLRKKSAVHASIIDEMTGRRQIKSKQLVYKNILRKKEKWAYNGSVSFKDHLQKLTADTTKIKANYNRFKRTPQILVVGPGKGIEVKILKDLFLEMDTKIDTIGLTNFLESDAQNLIHKDFSPDFGKLTRKDLFEHFNHLKLVNKYEYIYSAHGPLEHTRYPEIVILKITSMLKQGGFARIFPSTSPRVIENVLNYLRITGHEQSISLNIERDYIGNNPLEEYLIIKRLK